MKALTYDDITLIPASLSFIPNRDNVQLATPLTIYHSIEVPIIASPMNTVVDEKVMIEMNRLGTIAFLPRFYSIEERINKVKEVIKNRKKTRIPIGIAYGLKDNDDFLKKMFDLGVEIFLLDIANGHSFNAFMDIAFRKKAIPDGNFILGNLATEIKKEDWALIHRGVQNKIKNTKWTPDAFRVGIGSGSVCTTRITTGFGIPMIQSILNTKKSIENLRTIMKIHGELVNNDIPIIADGGIRMPGDAMKAFAVGANSVMIGSLFADCVDSASPVIEKKSGRKYKIYKGSASYSAKISAGMSPKFIEGVETEIPYNENKTIESVINSFSDGIKSGLSYANAYSLSNYTDAEFYEISQAGMIEGRPHLKEKMQW